MNELVVPSVRGFSAVVMSAVCGGLIAIPPATTMHFASGTALVAVTSVVGGLMGYRKRYSAGYFYFTLVMVLILASLVFRNSFQMSPLS